MNANRTLAFLSELDDEDLLLELDDDDKYRQISNKTLNSNKEKDEDEDLFKIPDQPIQSSFSINSKSSFSSTCKEPSNKQSQQAKAYDFESTQICDGFDQRQQSILEDLFENDDQEDEEDDYIKNQPIFASTQMGTISSQQRDSTVKTSNSNSLASKINSSVIVTTASTAEIMSSSKLSSTMNRSVITNDACIETHPCWKYAQQDLVNTFRKLQFENDFLKKYNIQYYFKNFFEYDLLSTSQDNTVRKLPLICVCIKEIARRPTNASIVLSDGIEKVKGTISNNVIKEYWHTLTMNAVLLLEDVCLLRINYNKNGYHLNINLHNIICIYYPNLEEPMDQINKLELKQLNRQKICTSLNEFKKKYIDFEIKMTEKPAGNSNKSSTSIVSADQLSNTVTHNRNRPAPYTVPNRDNQNKITHFNSNDRLHVQRKEKTPQTNNQPIKPKELNINNNIKTSNLHLIPTENKNTNHRSFSFVNKEKAAIQTNPSLNTHCQNKSSTVLAESNALSSQRQLSEEVLSQLIFGIEDELLNDDDL